MNKCNCHTDDPLNHRCIGCDIEINEHMYYRYEGTCQECFEDLY